MTSTDWRALSTEFTSLLTQQSSPLAITFSNTAPEGVSPFDSPFPAPAEDGRTGRVPAGCVFWVEASNKTFTTVAEDHANCSVGSLTHGFKSLQDVAGNADVAALLGSGWVTMDVVPQIPVVKQRFQFVTYGPLGETSVDPDVVFLRLNAIQAMMLLDAYPNIRFEGKPQCHIVAIAKELNQPAISVGCMLSRVRTGIPASEMTCAIPAASFGEVVEALKRFIPIDAAVAQYASKDAARFGRSTEP
ncbi:MAG: DUF169 domain-containing protein [Blastocatellia bacterium]